MRFPRRATVAFLIAAAVMAPSSSLAGLLNPGQFTSLGTLAVTSATPVTYVINGTSLIIGTTIYTGQLYQGVAVFDFSSIYIGPNVTLTASGGVPIAFLSQSNAVISGEINVSANATLAGAGAANTATGGTGGSQPPLISGGGGGGFGGSGGNGGAAGSLAGGTGGSGSFIDLNNTFEGGSKGGGGYGNSSGGGGGGGAIQISAINTLTIGVGGSIYAMGGNGATGGGGSGGGILLGATNLLNFGLLDAQGGAGAPGSPAGPGAYPGNGGGGGGIIEMLANGNNPGTYFPGTQNVNGGGGGIGLTSGQAGQAGLADFGGPYPFSVPEPPSLILLGGSTLGLLGLARVRRVRDRRAAPRHR